LIHDPALYDRLSALPAAEFSGEVFRATRKSLDPLAFSTRGGRWAKHGGAAVLYTSLSPEGALAEINYHWRQLTPLPCKHAVLHTLKVTTQRTLRLLRANLSEVGLDPTAFLEPAYTRCQEVGAAVAFLGYDGLIVPSARWEIDNLVLFGDNHAVECELTRVSDKEIDWLAWGATNGLADG
jgi:RES domain-containing protein